MDRIVQEVEESSIHGLLSNLNRFLWRMWEGSYFAHLVELLGAAMRHSALASIFAPAGEPTPSAIAGYLREKVGTPGELSPAMKWEKALIAFMLFFVPVELLLITKLPSSVKYLGDLALVVVTVSLLLRLSGANWPIRRTPADFPILVIVGAGILGAIMNSVPVTIAAFGIRAYIEYYFLYLVLAYLPWAERERRSLILWFLVFAVAIALLGDAQKFLHVATPRQWLSAAEKNTTRAFGTMDNPNTFAGFVVLTLTFLTSLLVLRVKGGIRTLAIVGIVIALPALVFSLSREALIAFAVAALMIGAIADRRLLLLLILGAVMLPIVDPSLVQRFTYAFSQGYVATSAQYGRLLYWEKGLQILQAYPFFGAGPGRFGGSVAHLYGSPAYAMVNLGFKPIIDSEWVQAAAELGIVGFLGYLALGLAAIRAGIRLYREELDPFWKACGLTLAAGTAAFYVQSVFASLLETHQVVIVFWMTFGMVVWRLRQNASARSAAPSQTEPV